MSANEIREKFLKFFESKGHAIVASDSVVPKNDPTVLFTTAGMQQFKRQFLGQGVTYKRAASSQKCLRTDDLDKVGKTPFHHTFFEMLGNFSFGDYFKKEAIAWAWEFLTQELKIPKEKLWVSVYEEDDEACNIWLNDIKIPKEKIVKLGDKSNFWPSEAKTKGPNGPCGPCSEIFYDYGVNKDCPKGKKCDPDCSCGRFSEVWNLVFTQFNRKEGGVLEPLPGKNIDTGMGFERLVAVVQGKKSNYETDLFLPIIAVIDAEAKKANCKLTDEEKNIIADHLRAIVFGICDGVMPSNENRGYVIKRLIIDAADIFIRKSKAGPITYKIVPTVADVMLKPYPELGPKTIEIANIIKTIEESYLKVRKERIPELEREIQEIKLAGGISIPMEEAYEKLGRLIFKYRDTYGLTIDTIKKTLILLDVHESHQIKVFEKEKALEKFTQLMGEQQKKSRASSKMTGDVFADAELNLNNIPKTEFVGYKNIFKNSAKILKIFVSNKEVSIAKQGDAVKLILNKTPFYAESGGQIGDTGTISNGNNIIRIIDTKKIADVFIHFGQVEKGNFKAGDVIKAQIDEDRRLSIMRNHTATHLLQAALRKILGSHVQQQGSLVAEDRLRFDFTHPQAVNKEQINKIESLVNDCIKANDNVDKNEMPIQEAKKSGALAFFAEKYGDTVRVVAIDGYSKEFCGGTHLNSTGEVGSFKITSEGAVAQGMRRIEAVTGTFVNTWAKGREAQEKIRRNSGEQKQKEKEQSDKNFEKIKGSIDTIIKESENIGTITVIRHHFKNIEPELLRKISDLIKQKVKSAVIALACENNGSANVLIVVTDDLVKRNIKANELIQEIASAMNASGGGRPQMAQAGGKDASRLEAALKKLDGLLKGKG